MGGFNSECKLESMSWVKVTDVPISSTEIGLSYSQQGCQSRRHQKLFIDEAELTEPGFLVFQSLSSSGRDQLWSSNQG